MPNAMNAVNDICGHHHFHPVDLAIIPSPPFGALGADTKAHALPLSYTATEGGGFVWAALELKR